MTFKLLSGAYVDGIKKSIEKRLRKDKIGIKRTIFVFSGKREDLMAAEMFKLENIEKLGRFNCIISNGVEERTTGLGTVSNFRRGCERCYQPTGQKHKVIKETNPETLPLITRANGCPAYISHMFFKFISYEVCIQRVYANHSGHDINNPLENRVAKISSELKQKIMLWFRYKIRKAEILRLCHCWAKDNGHLDPSDRCYYPTSRQIANLYHSFRNSVSRFLTSDHIDKCIDSYKDHVIYFQRLDEKSKTPLIILSQTNWQFDQMKKLGNRVVFFDANFSGILTYGYAVYALLSLDETGKAVPLTFALASEENEESVVYNFLNELICAMQIKGFFWQPQAFVVNKDVKVVEALKKLFRHSVPILMCWQHVLQEILEWSTTKDSAVYDNKQSLNEVLEAMVLLKNCFTENEFLLKWHEIMARLPEKCVAYLNDNWIENSKMWASYGRRSLQSLPITNSAVEKIFATKVNQILHGLIVIPLDEMLAFLLSDLINHYSDFDHVIESYRIKLSDCSLEKARTMFSNGLGNRIIFKEDGQQLVPSQTLSDVFYSTCVDESRCTCSLVNYGIKCKHLWLVELFCEENGNLVNVVREENAAMIMQTGNYQRLDNFLLVPNLHNQFTSLVNIDTACCNCLAASFSGDCTCLRLLAKLQASSSEQFEITAVYFEESNDDDADMAVAVGYDAAASSLDAKGMCEDILEKLNSGWKPTVYFLKDLHKLHSQAVDTKTQKRQAVPATRGSPTKKRC